jgi:hypothetical protein
MPKSSRNPPRTCIELKRLELACLIKNGMLLPGNRLMTMTWSKRGIETGSISVESFITPGADCYLLLSYTVPNGTQHEYRVDLDPVRSNLPGSTASRYYMVCPVSGRRASILYLREGAELFAHRQAYPTKRLYYDSELELKRYRGLSKNAVVQKIQQREYGRKYRKVVYAGKEAKWSMSLDIKAFKAKIATDRAILRLGPY